MVWFALRLVAEKIEEKKTSEVLEFVFCGVFFLGHEKPMLVESSSCVHSVDDI